MLSIIRTATVIGLSALPVSVEVDISSGLPTFTVVGLPDAAIKEAKERVRSAIANSEFDFPLKRITVNLAPGDLKKEGPLFDLPIAVGTLAAAGFLKADRLHQYLVAGELSLTGEVKPVQGVLSIAVAAKELVGKGVVVPKENAGEASLIRDVEVIPVSTLQEAVDFLNGTIDLKPVEYDPLSFLPEALDHGADFSDVRGQESVKRALEVAVAGGHNVLMIGPPGSGKTMLAKRLPGIMPALSFEEAVDVTRIYSVAGLLRPGEALVSKRPFRAPHHTISAAGLVGGGSTPRPGEVSLSHYGILFLDEFPEFGKHILEVLRQPLEDRVVTISRASGALTYPADFMLVASMNPCPCGFLGDRVKQCTCTHHSTQRYRARLSGPLLDRIDIQVEVPRLTRRELMSGSFGESSANVRGRVEQARSIQRERYSGSSTAANSSMNPKQVREHCRLSSPAADLLEKAIERLALSGRAHERILKVARTIADLAGSRDLNVEHVAEAIQYRALDRGV